MSKIFKRIFGNKDTEEIQNKISESELKEIDYGSVTDIDGNTYKTVKIGNQEWMAENLIVSHYRNGDIIPNVTDPMNWSNLTTGAWCYYNNNLENGKIYGKLYNWHAVNDSRGIAPQGWHIPKIEEWKNLEKYLGGRKTAGGKLKAITKWEIPNKDASDLSGFTALPGGYRYIAGNFFDIDKFGYFWSSSEEDDFYAWNCYLSSKKADLSRYYNLKENGYSIRCLKD